MSTSAGAAVTAAASDNLYAQPRTTVLLLPSCCCPSLLLCFVLFESILIWPSARAAITAFSSFSLRSPPSPSVSLSFFFSPTLPCGSIWYVKGISNPKRWLTGIIEYQKTSQKVGDSLVWAAHWASELCVGAAADRSTNSPVSCRSSGQDAQRDACRSLPHAWIHIQTWQQGFLDCEAF